jgi:hypothetical protein
MAGREVRVQCRHSLDGLHADVTITFKPHRPLGLHMVPHQLQGDHTPQVGQDIEIGETDFDDTFVIKGYDPASVLQTCNQATRDALMALQKIGRVALTDHTLQVVGADADHETLGHALRLATEAADAMDW